MVIQMWFREDIEHSLLAVYAVMQATTTNASEKDAQSADYCQGFEDALKCVAASFGIKLFSDGVGPAPEGKQL